MHRLMRLFFTPGEGGAAGSDDPAPAANMGQETGQQNVNVDYEKIQHMLDGTLKAKEETALKAYFKQQGLSQEEAEQAMATFKAEKAKNTPDANALQTQVTQANELAMKAQIEQQLTLAAVSLGLDAKNIPYVLKLAETSGIVDQDGKIKEDAVKAAVNKVLEDVPALKPSASVLFSGFKVGGDGGQQTQQTTVTQNQVPARRWNRFNN